MTRRSLRCYFTVLIAAFVLLDKSLVQTTGSQQTIAFQTLSGDDIAFEGETVNILCSQGGIVDDTNIQIYSSSGEIDFVVFHNGTHRIALATLMNVLNNMTFHCNISDEKMASVKLSIFTIPRETSPHCYSNYTNGLLEGDSVQMSCYSDGSYGIWEASSDAHIEYFSNEFIHTFTRKTAATVRPSAEENGTIYSCVSNQPGRGSSSCSVGPMFVYKDIRVSFEPNANLSKVSPGESRKFNCLSTPSSNVQWTGMPQNDGVVLDIDGPLLSVNVLSNSTFRGNINVFCVGGLNGVQGSTMLSLQIIGASTPAPSGTTYRMDVITPKSTASTNQSTSALDKMIILIILGAVGCILIIIIVLLFTLYFCRFSKKEKSSTKTVQSVVVPSNDVLGNHDYTLPPCGKTTFNHDCSTASQAVGLRPDNYTVMDSGKEKNGQVQSYSRVTKDNNGGFIGNIEDDITISTDNNNGVSSESPAYAAVNRNRRVLIDSSYLDDEAVF